MSFKDWWTNENNPSLPKSSYMWGYRHIIMLCVAVVAAIILSILFFKRSQKAKDILLKILASVLLFFEIASRIVNLIIANSYTFKSVFQIIMPLHICSVAVWVLIIGVFAKNRFLLNFACIVGLLATVAFLLFPAVGINKTYISFTCLYSITSHVTGFVVAILLMTLKFVKFEFKKIWQVLLCFAAMFLWGVLVDWVIIPGADYMYLRNDPLELNLNFPYHIIYVVIILAYISLFYLIPFIVKKIKNSRQNSESKTA